MYRVTLQRIVARTDIPPAPLSTTASGRPVMGQSECATSIVKCYLWFGLPKVESRRVRIYAEINITLTQRKFSWIERRLS